MRKQFLKFALAGSIGYAIDVTVLYAALSLGSGYIHGRLISFLFAAYSTWIINRSITFKVAQRRAQETEEVTSEWGKYFTAMIAGGILNIGVYALLVSKIPPTPALPAVAVAAGSIVGLIVNFLSSKFLVFANVAAEAESPPRENKINKETIAITLIILAFLAGHMNEMNLPGLYMDAVNPDYLAARTINSELRNPHWAIPSSLGIILGGLYHGAQNYFISIPVSALLGFNLPALRFSQGLFAIGILIISYKIIKLHTKSIVIAALIGIALATELSFIASFRNQNYIVISGAFWLLIAIYKLSKPEKTGRDFLISGVSAGLAFYSYFVYLLFLPAFILNIISIRNKSPKLIYKWCAGFVLGCIPYVIGYLSLVYKLGGFLQTKEWLTQVITGLSPLGPKHTFIDTVIINGSYFINAITNSANEQLILGSTISSNWSTAKFWTLLAISAVTVIMLLLRNGTRKEADSTPTPLEFMPIYVLSFFVCSLAFGSRLGAHHYSSLIPLLYIASASAITSLFKSNRVILQYAFVALITIIPTFNLLQQADFFTRLSQSGGTKYFSSALNQLAEEAVTTKSERIYAFPEWGFMMPFAYLTGNQVEYFIELNDHNLSKIKDRVKTVSIPTWDESNIAKYTTILNNNTYTVTEITPHHQRDGKIAFFVIHARPDR